MNESSKAPLFIHEKAIVDSVSIGAGTRIWAFAHVMKGALIGEDCNIGEGCYIEGRAIIGNDVTITIGGQSGSFQLNVMLPVIAYNLIQSIDLLANASRVLADKAVQGFTVNEERIAELVGRNPILVTALNPVIGYELGAKIAKTAYAQGRSLKDVALEMTDLSAEELDRLLDPRQLTEGGIQQ